MAHGVARKNYSCLRNREKALRQDQGPERSRGRKRKKKIFLSFILYPLSLKGGSVLIVSLWILTIFVMLVVSLGYRSHIEAQLCLREQEYFKAEQLLFSGMNLAHYYINADDDTSVDSIFDTWYNQIEFSDDIWESKDLSISIHDEESKININQVQKKALTHLFEYIDEEIKELHAPVEDLVDAILVWRGEESLKDKNIEAYDVKSEPFDSLYELLLIKDIPYADFFVIKDYLTVYANDENILKINLNTASTAAMYAVIMSLTGDERHKKDIFEKLATFKANAEKLIGEEIDDDKELPYFTANDLSPYNFLERIGVSSDVISVSLAIQLMRYFTVDSKTFSVAATVFRDDHSLMRTAHAVLGRKRGVSESNNQKNELTILSWNEL